MAGSISSMNKKRRRIWVDGAEFGTAREAGREAGVSTQSVWSALKAGGRMVNGYRIGGLPALFPAEEEPIAPPEADPPAPGGRKPLLRYPPGKGPLYRGSGRLA
jgi:hypothetical protein